MSTENRPAMKNLKTKKLYLQVYDEVKDYIVQNQLKTGDRLPTEREMCEILGVSRNVLREAIKSLEITGVVCSTPGVGIVIREFNMDYLFDNLFGSFAGGGDESVRREVSKVRSVLEIGFARESFESLTAQQLVLLREQLDAMQVIANARVKSPSDEVSFGQKFARADAAFHKLLFQGIGNNLLLSIINSFWACDKYYKVNVNGRYLEQTVAKHARILAAAEAHDASAFLEAVEYHFRVNYKVNGTEPSK